MPNTPREKIDVRREDLSIDDQGRVIIKNDALRQRAEAFLNQADLGVDPQAGLLDNCDCKCGAE